MTLNDFKAMFPEVTGYTDAYMQIWLDVATNQVDSIKWGADTNTGVGLLAAHYITVDDSAMATSQTVGGMSLQYSNGEDLSHYNMTMYGRQFYRLMMIYGIGGTVV